MATWLVYIIKKNGAANTSWDGKEDVWNPGECTDMPPNSAVLSDKR